MDICGSVDYLSIAYMHNSRIFASLTPPDSLSLSDIISRAPLSCVCRHFDHLFSCLLTPYVYDFTSLELDQQLPGPHNMTLKRSNPSFALHRLTDPMPCGAHSRSMSDADREEASRALVQMGQGSVTLSNARLDASYNKTSSSSMPHTDHASKSICVSLTGVRYSPLLQRVAFHLIAAAVCVLSLIHI